MRVAGVLDLSVPIPPPFEGGGLPEALQRFSVERQGGSKGTQTCPGGRLMAEPWHGDPPGTLFPGADVHGLLEEERKEEGVRVCLRAWQRGGWC